VPWQDVLKKLPRGQGDDRQVGLFDPALKRPVKGEQKVGLGCESRGDNVSVLKERGLVLADDLLWRGRGHQEGRRGHELAVARERFRSELVQDVTLGLDRHIRGHDSLEIATATN